MFYKIIGLLFFVFYAIPAYAQSSKAASTACLIQTEEKYSREKCIYEVMQKYESYLDEAEEKALEKAKQLDKENQPIHNFKVEFYNTQLKSNETYRAYIKAECDRFGHSVLASNAAGILQAQCKIDLISQRLNYLEQQKR